MKTKKQRRYIKLFPLFAFFVIPVSCVIFWRNSIWIGRLLAISIAFLCGSVASSYYSLNPKTKMLGKSAKFNLPKYDNARKYIVFSLRVFILGISIYLIYMSILLIGDIDYLIKKGEPYICQGKVKVASGIPCMEWMAQALTLSVNGEEKHYYFLYSLKPRLKSEKSYRLYILPQTKIVLDAVVMNE